MAKKKSVRKSQSEVSQRPKARSTAVKVSVLKPDKTLRRMLLDRAVIDRKIAQHIEARNAISLREFAAAQKLHNGPRRTVALVGTMGPRRSMLKRASVPSAASRAAPYIVAEGDSWFNYSCAGKGIISFLHEMLYEPPLDWIAQPGDTVANMLSQKAVDEIAERLETSRLRYDAILFSGGGNDILGFEDRFARLIRDYKPGANPSDLIDAPEYERMLDEIETGFVRLLAVCSSRPTLPILVNAYDFPTVSGKGVTRFGPGPWLKPTLEITKKIPTTALQNAVVKELLVRYRDRLLDIGARLGNGRFHVVDTQGTIRSTPDDWANEIHPKNPGFIKLARKFHSKLRQLFPAIPPPRNVFP